MAETSSHSPGESIYTVLVFVTLLALAAGVIYVLLRGQQVFGGWTWFLPK